MPGYIDPQAVLRNPAYIHESAYLYGKVTVEEGASIWVNAVARAEHKEIVIGAYTNIQDFVMLHIGDATPTIIGSHCSITHHCTIHGCVIGENSIVGGHSFLKEGTVVPPNSIVTGVPGKVTRTQNNFVRNRINAYMYYKNALAYAAGEHRAWAKPEVSAEVQEEIRRLEALLAGAA
jgi:carbonic anhydrase/acetyltransferase-like protein (isoleucine patch superfamily)